MEASAGVVDMELTCARRSGVSSSGLRRTDSFLDRATDGAPGFRTTQGANGRIPRVLRARPTVSGLGAVNDAAVASALFMHNADRGTPSLFPSPVTPAEN